MDDHLSKEEQDKILKKYKKMDNHKLKQDLEILLRAFHYERCRMNIGLDEARKAWGELNKMLELQNVPVGGGRQNASGEIVLSAGDQLEKQSRWQRCIDLLNLFFKPVI